MPRQLMSPLFFLPILILNHHSLEEFIIQHMAKRPMPDVMKEASQGH